MKQTSNAIKFLMAQYRAIFKSAYFKGLATAAVVTAGLAAGQAQAVNYSNTDLAGTTPIADVDGTNNKVQATYTADGEWNAAVTISGGATSDNYIKDTGATGQSVSVSGLGSLTISSTDAANGLSIQADTKALTVNIASANITKGTLLISGSATARYDATFAASTISLSGAAAGDSKIVLQGKDGSGAAILGTEGSQITLGDNSSIVFSGTTAATAAKMLGHLDGQGGTLDFTSGNGTIETWGSGTLNIKVGNARATDALTAEVSLTDDPTTTDNEGRLEITGGTITLTGNTSTDGKDATLKVASGTLALGDGVSFDLPTAASSGTSILAIENDTDAANAVLEVNANKLQDFLTNTLTAADHQHIAGAVDLTKGTLYLNSTETITLNDFTFGTTAGTEGSINLGTDAGNSVIAGKDLAVTGALANATNLNVDAESLTLGAEDLKTTDVGYTGFGVNELRAKSVTFLHDATTDSGTFVLKDTLALYQDVVTKDNPYYAEDGDPTSIYLPGSGSLGSTDLEIDDTGDGLTVETGNFTADADLTLNGGSLQVGLGSGAGSEIAQDHETGFGIDASLTVNHKLVLTNDGSEDNTITVAGNSNNNTKEGLDLGSTSNGYDATRETTATLDLRGATIEFTDNTAAADKLTTINVNEDGLLLLTGDQLNFLLNKFTREGQARSGSGAGFVLSGDGEINVDGSYLTLDVKDLGSSTDAATDTIQFNGGGFLVASELTINDAPAKPGDKGVRTVGLAIGKGTLKANDIDLRNTHYASATSEEYDSFQVKSGNLEVGSKLSSINSSIVFGDGTSGASLTLGWIEQNTDQYGVFDGSYSLSDSQGQVTQNLVFSGGTAAADNSALKVVYGDWTAQNITATNTKITLGGEQVTLADEVNKEYKQDADGNEYTTSLSVNSLDLGNGSVLEVNRNATANIKSLTLSGDANGTITNTTVTIEGNHTGAGTADESWGLSTAASTELTVTGRQGNLVINGTALGGITASQNEAGEFTYANANDDQNAFVSVENWATLTLNFGEGVVFGEDSLRSLRQNFIYGSSGNPLTAGYIDIGSAQIDGIVVSEDNTISWNDLEQYKDIIADIITDDTSKATLIDVDAADKVQANVGNVLANGSTVEVQFNDSTLRAANSDGYFISNKNGSNAVGARVLSNARLGLYNGGRIGDDVTLETGTENRDTILDIVADVDAEGNGPVTIIEGDVKALGDHTTMSVNGIAQVQGSVDVGTLDVNQSLTVNGNIKATEGLESATDADGKLVTTGSVTTSTGNLTVTGGANYAGDITVTSGSATFGSLEENEQEVLNPRDNSVEYYLAGDNSFNAVTFYHDTELSTGTTTATTVRLGQDLAITGNGTLDADVVEFVDSTSASSAYITVGEAASDTNSSFAGYMNVGRLDLAGRTLLVDPAYGQAASIVAVGQFGAEGSATELLGNDAGVLDGRVVGLQNSIIAMGVSDTADQKALDQVRATFANFLDANGSLSADNVGAIGYVAKAINVEGTSKIVLNSALSAQQYLDIMGASNSSLTADQIAFKDAVNDNNVYLGANTALAISADALTSTAADASGAQVARAAMHFDTNEASIYGDGGKIVLVNTNTDVNQEVTLFTDNGGEGHEGIMVNGQNITVESLSGLYYLTFKAGEETTSQLLQLNAGKLQEAYYAASDPVKATLNAYALSHGSHDSNALHGDAAPSTITYEAATNTFTNTSTGETITDNSYVALDDGNGGYNIYEAAYNPILAYTETNDFSGATAETVARMGAFAGVAQAALAAGATTYDAISGRMGIGSQASSMTFAENGQGAGLWLTPVYKNHDSDSFDAEGIDYGVDMDLYGVALGADYTLANGLRVGAMFNIGSGEADGQGAGSAVTNDFDYYGFGIYAGYTFGQFSVVGDVSYTVVDNDVEANTAVDKVGASLDSTNLSVGVTAKYALDFDGLKVEPHAGLRYSSLDIDDYAVDGAQTYANFSSDSMDVFSIPVGVTIAKDFTAGAWQVKPSFDLTLTGNFGDDSFNGDVSWDGIANHVTSTSTEVLDNFTYGATVGVAAQTGSFSLGLGLNYTGSENANEFGVNANARYVF